MNHDLIIRPEAEADLAAAYAWYEERRRGLGSEFLLSVDAIFHSVVRNPHQYLKIYKTTRRAILHRFPYAVFFLVDDKRVIVLAVFHVKRDPKQWRRRE